MRDTKELRGQFFVYHQLIYIVNSPISSYTGAWEADMGGLLYHYPRGGKEGYR